MYCIGINHKTADSKIRSELALSAKDRNELYSIARESENIEGIVILMTCNRNEIYYTGKDAGIKEIEQAISIIKGISVADVKKNFMRFFNEQALRHLYNVACGLDSAVIGEVEIIRQIKDAYKESCSEKLSDSRMNICIQGALNTAKDVAEKSLMTRLPVSVGTLTAEAVLDFLKDKNNPTVMIVGASGNMGSIVLNNLLDLSLEINIICTARKHSVKINDKFDDSRVTIIEYKDRYEHMYRSDVIVSATSSPHYTFVMSDIENERLGDSMKLFIDLAIPRDIDVDIEKNDTCIIRNIDYIKELAKDNNAKKIDESKKVKLLIDERVDEQMKNLLFRDYMQSEEAVKILMEEKKTAKLVYQLRDSLPYEEFKKVMEIIKEDKDGIFSIYDSIG